MRKEAMNLKAVKEGYMGGFGQRKAKNLIIISKTK